MTLHGRRIEHAAAQAGIDCQLERARGASVIASMLSKENVAGAIGETLAGFVSVHGATDLRIFTQLLGLRLVERNRPDAADMLLTWKPAPSGPAAQKSNAPRHRNPSH